MAKKLGIENRSVTLYVRIKPTNKAFLKKLAKKNKLSEAQMLDLIIDEKRYSGLLTELKSSK